MSSQRKFTFVISSPGEFLVLNYLVFDCGMSVLLIKNDNDDYKILKLKLAMPPPQELHSWFGFQPRPSGFRRQAAHQALPRPPRLYFAK